MAEALDHEALQRWRADPIRFIETVLYDPESKRPFVLLPAERSFLQHAFSFDEDGRLKYSELVYGAIKKSGKTTLAAIFTLTLLLLFGGAYPEAVCCANDAEQAASRVHSMIRRIVESSPLLRRAAKVISDRITFADLDAVITAIPSDYAGAAGGNQNIAVFDEAWAYVSERSQRLFDEMVPPPTRKIACRLTVTYAGFSGESVLLEQLYQRGMALPEVGPSLHAGDGLLMAWHHEPVAPWQTEAWIAEMRRSLRPNQFLRMIENRFVSTESSFIDMAAFDVCVDPDLRPVVTDRSLPVWCAVDASVKHDSTALAAVSWDKEQQRVQLVAHRIFQPSPERPIDFADAVEQTLHTWRGRYQIKAVLFDPFQMIATSQRLAREGFKMQEFPQTLPNLTEASQNLFELIRGRSFATYHDAEIRLAFARAVAIESPRGWRIGKDKQAHKIDIVVALMMAALGCVRAQARGSIRVFSGGLTAEVPIIEIDGRTGRRIDQPPRTRIRVVKIDEAAAPTVRANPEFAKRGIF